MTAALFPGPVTVVGPVADSVHWAGVAVPPTTVLCSVRYVQVTVFVIANEFSPLTRVWLPLSPEATLLHPGGSGDTVSPTVTASPTW